MAGLIGKKIGMTSMFSDEGKNIPCTIIQAGPCTVTQIKTNATDGYDAVQISFDEQKESRLSKALLGHYKNCLLYTSPSPRDKRQSRMPSSA